jgi:hypothetical protein
MGITDVSTIFAVQFDEAVDKFLVACQSIGISPNVAAVVKSGDGYVDPTFVAAGRIKPTMWVTTNDLKNALDVIGLSGKALSASSIMKTYLNKVAAGGTRTAGATHTLIEMNEGIIVPTSITVTDGQAATVSYIAFLTYDGTNVPIKVTVNQSLPTITPSVLTHTTGPIQVNGAAIEGIQSMTLDFGIDVTALGGDGEVYDTFAGIMSRNPTLKFTTTDCDIMDTFEVPTNVSATVVAYLTKMSAGTVRVANNVAEHIKLTMTAGMVNNEALTLTQGQNGTVDGLVNLAWDGSNDIVAINTASAIT